MSKLTLTVDASVISRAKRYAKEHRISLSQIVEAYLASVSDPKVVADWPPVLRSLRGILKRADIESYRRQLSKKYR